MAIFAEKEIVKPYNMGKKVCEGVKRVILIKEVFLKSANNPTPPINVSATFLTDPKDIAKFMEKRKKANAGNK